ncbi:hypothetical protein QFC19_003880 [Naganishia cerealis]|uniref:Uncharacterized protein n=1 Tax=Naganishia cerealis TaxID=610337 RepID=A0ACC2VZ25_9TREE|nr:hypothetical protein QFC19_003880 [Naganishia cerealis]
MGSSKSDINGGDGIEDQQQSTAPWWRGPLFEAGWKFSALWIVFTVLMAGTVWMGLPRLDPEDKSSLKLPRSFADLQALKQVQLPILGFRYIVHNG